MTRMEELAELISRGWGTTPGRKIPANWMETFGPDYGNREERSLVSYLDGQTVFNYEHTAQLVETRFPPRRRRVFSQLNKGVMYR